MKIFIGYDARQPIAFSVCAQSIYDHASKPVEIVRLDLRHSPVQRIGQTDFTYSRFLVPYLSNFEGQSIFLDPDILVRGDICDLFSLPLNAGTNVSMVMHEQEFERPSVMVFQNDRCAHMTPEYVKSEKMFEFEWVRYPTSLPKEWNHLIGFDKHDPDAKLVHFTKGIPVWPETIHCEFAQEWIDTFRRMTSSVPHKVLMSGQPRPIARAS